MVWTPELKAKAAATRAETKRKKEERLAKKEANNGNSHVATVPDPVSTGSVVRVEENPVPVSAFNWETASLQEIIERQASMKNEYDRISEIVLRRANPPGTTWVCWTEEQRRLKNGIEIPKAVATNCARTGADGKWKFRDDGRFEVINGVRTLRPAFCCNSACFSLYQMYRGFRAR